MDTLYVYVLLAIGGAIGTVARYAISVAAQPFCEKLPWGTVAINIIGSFIIGFFSTLTLAHGKYPASENMRLFVMVGLCGGFTTFSSFSLQTLDLMRSGSYGRAMLNVTLSVVLCVGAVALGHMIANKLNPTSQIVRAEIKEEA